MLSGRPPLPMAVKQANGNTRKLSKAQFAAEMNSKAEARRGCPPMPIELKGPTAAQLVAATGTDLEATLLQVAVRMEYARGHWKFLIKELSQDGLLAMVDQGVILSLALSYAGMLETAQAGKWKDYSELMSKYLNAADRCGLNESARARLPRRVAPKVDPLEEALSGEISSPLPVTLKLGNSLVIPTR
jgi:hypothetical protein